MLKTVLAVALAFALFQTSYSHAFSLRTSAEDSAKAYVRAALEAMGGEERLRSVKSVQLAGIGHTYLIEQSERPEGPWIVNYEQFTERRDFVADALRRTSQNRNIQSANWAESPARVVVAGVAAVQNSQGKYFPGSTTQAAEAEETLALSPERVLLTALAAKDLRAERDTTLQGSTQHVVAFGWRDATARLYLSAQTSLPTAIELTRAYPDSIFWGVWGDVRTRTYLSLWTLESGGLRYPRQWNVERNGIPYQEVTIAELAFNPVTTDGGALTIPEDVREAFKKRGRTPISDIALGRADKPATEIAPGVVQIPGRWNVALVKQDDGLVIIEAPISSGYSAKVIAEAARRFPGVPIKAVVSTSDSWPHIGGVREYVSREIPVYALDLNRPILERLLAARYTSYPDALERAQRKAKFRIVAARTVLGAGANRIELYPIRSETGERMMMVYFPEHKLLYGSDLVQPQPDGSFFMPEYLLELIDASKREKLAVKSIFAMHAGVIAWDVIEKAVEKARG